MSQQMTDAFPDQLILASAPPGPPSAINASLSGAPGVAAYYYWVLARYPIGATSFQGPAPILNAPNTLSVSNKVIVTWNPAPGATSYDLLRTTTPQRPTNGATIALATSTTALTFTDDGGTPLVAYTFPAFATQATVVFQVDNKNNSVPVVYVSIDNGALAPLGIGGGVISPQNANLVYAGPGSGAAALPTFRALVAADIPAPPAGSITEAELVASSAFGLGVPRIARAKYDFAVDGGAISTITLATNALIPANAIVFGGIINPTTALTSGGSATIGIGTTAGSSATSIKGQTAVATYSLDALIATVPVFTAASAFKMSAAGQITITIAAATLLTGVMEVSVVYFVAAAA